ncbi:MAG: DUF1924 domain-containing protein [Deltaproteobacteria bacterium]|nr:DUF1924 domain-containing protein [Deltaproteobacteria bacterium]
MIIKTKSLLNKYLILGGLFILVLVVHQNEVLAFDKNPVVKAFQKQLESKAQNQSPGFKGFSAEEGEKLYHLKRAFSKDGETRSCTSCHTNDPTKPGETKVGKAIKPLAPKVNNERFTDVEKIEKWFRRNCKWVLERECTVVEKGHFIEFIYSI